MSFPFRLNTRPDTCSRLVEYLRTVVERFPDTRMGSDTAYAMSDAALGAFSVFSTQSPSFLDFQRNLQVAKGCNNATSLFGLTQISSDNQIRNLLDPVQVGALRQLGTTPYREGGRNRPPGASRRLVKA